MSQAEQKSFREMRRTGWGMGLYRDRSRGWIGGVCAGLSHHWDVAPWLVRLGAFALLLFTNWLAFWAYLAAWMFLLAPRPSRWEQGSTESTVLDYDEDQHVYRKRSVFRYADAPGSRLKKARERLDDAMTRVETMERYMTSRRYDLNREFSKL